MSDDALERVFTITIGKSDLTLMAAGSEIAVRIVHKFTDSWSGAVMTVDAEALLFAVKSVVGKREP